MRREEYACPNGCSLPPRKRQLREYRNGTYGFDFYDFTFCPCCGSLMPYSLKKLKGFFEVCPFSLLSERGSYEAGRENQAGS